MPERAHPSVFAVEDTAVQLTWGDGPDGPGARDITGLTPDTEHVVDPATDLRVHTLAPPPGPELFRFATISDMHIGDRDFAMASHFIKPLRRLGPPNFALRCATAALDE